MAHIQGGEDNDGRGVEEQGHKQRVTSSCRDLEGPHALHPRAFGGSAAMPTHTFISTQCTDFVLDISETVTK